MRRALLSVLVLSMLAPQVRAEGAAPIKPLTRFRQSVGTSLSYLRYSEFGSSSANLDIAELGLTGKYNALYLLEPNRWELSGNAFGTLVPVELSPGGLPAARWYGANARVGYRLPVNSVASTSFWVMTGWYFWGMWGLPANAYGIKLLSGPQVFLNARMNLPGRPMSVYFKYASIQDHADVFSFSNRELAVGGAVGIGSWGKHPLGATLDLSDAKFGNSNLTQNMHLVSVGAGVNLAI